MLDAWTECGALAWAQTLPRVAVPKQGKSVRGENTRTKGQQIPATLPLPATTAASDETTLLQSLALHGLAVAPLHGTLTAVTLSPAMITPGQWLTIALGLRKGEVPGGIDQLNAAVEPLMGLYNCINASLRMKGGEGYMPSPELKTADPVLALL